MHYFNNLLILFSLLFGIDETILINSSSFTDWKYFSFIEGEIQEIEVIDPNKNLEWDMGIMRNHFRTNGGKSGNGLGAAFVDSLNIFNENSWYELSEIEGEINFVEDGILENIYDIITHTYSEAPGSKILETWGWFDFDNNYQFNVNNYQYILRTANGEKGIKLWIQDYYNELGQSAHITLRYDTDFNCIVDECGLCGGDGSTCIENECAYIGDINNDLGYNVLDIVALVNCVLLNNCLDIENACAADINNDGGYNVLDVVALVNCVLNGDPDGDGPLPHSCQENNILTRKNDATNADLLISDNSVSINSNGFLGGVEMTLEHDINFSIELTKNCNNVSNYFTQNGITRLIIVMPTSNELFNYTGEFEIKELLIANSHSLIDINNINHIDSFKLNPSYPNPFNPVTNISFNIPNSEFVNLSIYDINGKKITNLINNFIDKGFHSITWNAQNVSSGIYFIKVTSNNQIFSEKITLIK